eukprot:NODE_13516_length_1161_cov_3.708897.p1 GENE.NODE_13516_length_1161_cov_3.708897~~NODE_13516_length_1161_cov_3.708897.p1  ORF type:complete len:193 (-),score=36.52 NODE_13516_length_1161_cov_3.708897:4-582(-)
MQSTDGQPCEESNFFQHEWSTHVPRPERADGALLSLKFAQASRCFRMVGVSDFATTSDNLPAEPGSFPFELIFKPLVTSMCNCHDYVSCMKNLATIEAGTPLFEVFALAAPGAPRQSIGSITLTSKLTTSSFGDNQLFFQHQHMEDDFAIHPEWVESLDGDLKPICGATKSAIEQGCSSVFMDEFVPTGDAV